MIRIKNLNIAFDADYSLEDAAAKRLKISPEHISKITIVHKALDARRYKNAPIYNVFTLDVVFTDDIKEINLLQHFRRDKNIEEAHDVHWEMPKQTSARRSGSQPIIAGFGPAGMFCALTLCRCGYQPIILERGHDIDARHSDVETFWKSGILDAISNVQFGEGGAGTFSDGKLTTRIHDSKISQVLDDFIEAGAPAEIRYLHKPHIGTDILRTVVKNIRQKIISLGGRIYFSSQMTDLQLTGSSLKTVTVNNKDQFPCSTLFLGIGHSARDTYEMLYKKGVEMQAKPFAVGVRIEHPQALINEAQYGQDADDPRLPTADYMLTFQNRDKGLSCYSFCMCPGGKVVAAASEKDRLTTNGMSCYARDSGIANSALLSPVTPADFGDGVLAGIEFQRRYENLAFINGGKNYFAPVQTVGDFLTHTHGSDNFLVSPTYQPGIALADLHDCLPDRIALSLEMALPQFDRKIHGFADKNAVMTGLEMRSSAPCRILRSRETFVSLNVNGLYPIGEGAGYAGGIISSAVDGINAALSYVNNNQADI